MLTEEKGCPYAAAQQVLSGKWTLLILHFLSMQVMRFGELQRALPEMTQTTLSKQLRQMEQNGLLERKVYPQIPPKVEYSLSPLGREFVPVLMALEVWGRSVCDYRDSHGRGGVPTEEAPISNNLPMRNS